ncbi:MAG TPA: glucose-1-phosphate adenylyltransferase [Rectinemataceae bacterium]|nr:glucose-1-phosphate adenylyltransferase [Rectinemataceae bacterium]
MARVISIVLGGGKGSRLFPLTKDRSKPAVPFGGKYRIVDIPISNCINSGFNQVYILTQFNSASLHLHLSRTYKFDAFSPGFVEILAAEQSLRHSGWYEGTADAVRKNLVHFRNHSPTHYIVVSGDQLYRMDLKDMLEKHIASKARLTIACTTVTREAASAFGIARLDGKGHIVEFMEKPDPDRDISDWSIPHRLPERRTAGRDFLASMGIYIFDAALLEESLANELNDFGKEIIPSILGSEPVNAYVFDGYWEDIGTIASFYEANIDLCSINPQFNFYDMEKPIYTHMRNLPASKINFSNINMSLTADGCIITNASIVKSIIGIRTIIESGASLDGVVCMGADYYETDAEKSANAKARLPNMGIGGGCIIKKAIIDKNARIGENCRIGIDDIERKDGDYGNWHIVDGIIVIPKKSVLPPGTVV